MKLKKTAIAQAAAGTRMKTLIVANQKGGVGKTFVTRHIIFYGLDAGLRVLAVDLDVQGNMSLTMRNLAAAAGRDSSLPASNASDLFKPGLKIQPLDCGNGLSLIAADAGIVEVERSDLLSVINAAKASFSKLAGQYDLCVIDTGPTVSNLLIAALSVGDFAVSPTKPDRDAIAGLASFFDNVRRVRDDLKINTNLASLGVLLNQVNKGRAYHRDAIIQLREQWGGIVLPIVLHDRAAYDIAKDRAVWATDKGVGRSLAAIEMRSVCQHIFNQMQMGV